MGVRELRLVVTVADYEDALRFYRDGLGLPEIGTFDDGAGRVSILDAGQATLELSDAGHAEHIDQLEVGRRVGGTIRVAFRVDDVDAATRELVARGATLLGAPVPTPWGSRNSRLEAPAEVQLTLFEQMEPEALQARPPRTGEG